jgi:PTH1 family peptidyl-tRNA hydrolase
MKLIAGLGNPGLCYKETKHNAGFWVMKKVSAAFKSSFNRRKFNSRVAQGRFKGESFILVKPLAFMNLSGQPVKNFIDYFKISLDDILIIIDDISLNLGEIRLRSQGSAGGHNGLRSVIKHLKTDSFARLRFGINTQGRYDDLSKHVLSPFNNKKDILKKNKMIEIAKDAVLCWFEEGIVSAMNRYNKKREE